MKPGQIVGAILGSILIILAVGAYYSDEPASKTEEGRIAIPFAILLGLLILAGSLGSGKKQETPKSQSPPQPPPASEPSAGPLCPACGRQVSAEYTVCPYCSRQLRARCPSCGKDVSGDFVVCPYCGTSLKADVDDEPPPPPVE